MQQLKFRVWDKEAKAMLGEFSDGIMIQATTGRAGHYDDDNNFVDDYEVMQFTGLKDKNGIDIYEGDICKRYHLQGIVSYHTERAMFIIQDGFNEPLFQEVYGIEVIGNVHEHPELMSGRHEA